jgi:hypothetical protein
MVMSATSSVSRRYLRPSRAPRWSRKARCERRAEAPPATGTYTLDARVTDLAGNQGTSASATFNVSKSPTPWSVTSYQRGYLPDPTGNALELIGDATTQHPLDLDSSPGIAQSDNTALVDDSDWVNNHPLSGTSAPRRR